MNFALAVFVLLVILALVALVKGIRIVRPYQKGVVERLGSFKTEADPGLHIIVPFIDSMILVDMREQVVDVPPQEVITKDNVVVAVDAVVFYEPVTSRSLVYNVADFVLAITKLAQTNLRNLIGDLDLDSALTSRDTINASLRNILDDATDKWGVRVVRVEIQRIDPPAEVVAAMHEQMKAERTRRASVTEASGFRESEILRAEGEKQSAILSAEGEKQSAILSAEGEAEAIRRVAEAEAFALETVAAGQASEISQTLAAVKESNVDSNVLAVKYLEALEAIADGKATKLVVPADFAGVLGAVSSVAAAMDTSSSDVVAVEKSDSPDSPW